MWFYQHLVDHWDLDHPFERLLVDTAVTPDPGEVAWINPDLTPGEERKVLTGIPGKTGIVYTLDRETGEFLWARPTVMQNVVSEIDPTTGAVVVNEGVLFDRIDQEQLVCPGSTGGKNWPAGAYSPRTNTMYYPMQNLCMMATTTTDQRDPSAVYGIRMRQELAAGADNVGTVVAISAETGKTVWERQQRAGALSLAATGGGLVFGGDANGRFRAFDDETGRSAVGNQPRFSGQRFPGDLCGRWKAVCCRVDRFFVGRADGHGADARTAAGRQRQSLCLRLALARLSHELSATVPDPSARHAP